MVINLKENSIETSPIIVNLRNVSAMKEQQIVIMLLMEEMQILNLKI